MLEALLMGADRAYGALATTRQQERQDVGRVHTLKGADT